tara:strand:- start:548 stop:736 length:189 start_codon:yes stop_codon:yes gene_type:complete
MNDPLKDLKADDTAYCRYYGNDVFSLGRDTQSAAFKVLKIRWHFMSAQTNSEDQQNILNQGE